MSTPNFGLPLYGEDDTAALDTLLNGQSNAIDAAMKEMQDSLIVQAGFFTSGPTPGSSEVAIQSNISVTFPTPFPGTPLVIPTVAARRFARTWTVNVDTRSATGFTCSISVSQPATTNNFRFTDGGLSMMYIAVYIPDGA